MTDGTLFTGKTVEDAVADGLRSLGLTQEQVEIEVISRGSRGLFGIGSEPAQVRLTPRASKSAAATAQQPRRRQPRQPGSHRSSKHRLRTRHLPSHRQPSLTAEPPAATTAPTSACHSEPTGAPAPDAGPEHRHTAPASSLQAGTKRQRRRGLKTRTGREPTRGRRRGERCRNGSTGRRTAERNRAADGV